MVNVTVMATAVLPVLVTARGTLVVGGDSLLKPIEPGLIICDMAVVLITSLITPEPGVGSVPWLLLASAVLAATLLYTRTQPA